jgi:hypothetical protein
MIVSRNNMNQIKILTLFFVIFLSNCEKKTPDWEYFPDMYDSPAVEAQEFDPTAPNKTGGRLPPAGTIPVEYTPYEFDQAIGYASVPNGGLKQFAQLLLITKKEKKSFKLFAIHVMEREVLEMDQLLDLSLK